MTAERLAGAGTFALVVAGVIAGFAATGPPQHVRAIELDHQRVSDLQTIERSVHDAAGRRRSEVDRVGAPLHGRDTWPRDPATGQPYGYGRLSRTRYVICATFASPSDADLATPATSSWRHGAGRTCYRLDANAIDDEPEVVERR